MNKDRLQPPQDPLEQAFASHNAVPVARAATYSRVSTDQQVREGYSLEDQDRRTRDYLDRQGWEFVDSFTDAGVSGKQKHRPGLDQLRANLASLDAVVVSSLDRLGRSTANLIDLYDEFECKQVRLVSLREHLDSSTPPGRLMRTLLSAVAEFEREMIAERITTGVAARAAKGKPHGRLHYGYRLNPDHSGPSWLVDEFEASILRRMFAAILAGESQQAIGRTLNSERVTTKHGGHWTQGTVRKLLRSRTLLGERRFRGEWHEADYAPIIDRETFAAAAAVMSANARPNSKRGGRGRPTRSGHIFVGGLLKCGCCGGSMVPRSDPYPGYYCMTRKSHGVDACPMQPVPKSIDEAALSYFRNEALDLAATVRQIEQAFVRRIAEARERREQTDRDAMSAEDRMRRVRRAFQDGKLDADDWREQRHQLTAEREAAESAVTAAVEHEQQVRQVNALTDAEEAALRRVAAISDAVKGGIGDAAELDGFRATLQRLFDGFTLHWLDPKAQETAVAEPPGWWEPTLLVPGGLYIEPHVRPDSIQSSGPGGWPTIKRAALDGNTDAIAFLLASVFGAIVTGEIRGHSGRPPAHKQATSDRSVVTQQGSSQEAGQV
jgi:site-specific DNA recombinase